MSIRTLRPEGDYAEQVQTAIETVTGFASVSEAANYHHLSAWYDTVGVWIRDKAIERIAFDVTLPDPTGGDGLTVIEIRLTREPLTGGPPPHQTIAPGGAPKSSP